ncbi:MAG: hypothetical protein R3C39_01945 [Dehalococcoidia bacterium]
MRRGLIVGLGALLLLVGACSSDSDSGSGSGDGGGSGGSGDNPFGALIGGGGGTLTFDGQEIDISSVVCQLGDDTFDVGSVSEPGHRVLVSHNNPQNPVSIQLLDPDFIQWFPEDREGLLVRDGGTFSAETATYWNNSDDRTIEASFRVECP